MASRSDKAGKRHFLTKMIIGSVIMAVTSLVFVMCLGMIQYTRDLRIQTEDSKAVLKLAATSMKDSASDARKLKRVFHDGNQDTLTDLKKMFEGGLMKDVRSSDWAEQRLILADVKERSGVDFLCVVNDKGIVTLASLAENMGLSLLSSEAITEENFQQLWTGTCVEGYVVPVVVNAGGREYYMYSESMIYEGREYRILLGRDARALLDQTDPLHDVPRLLRSYTVNNNGFLIGLDPASGTIRYLNDGVHDHSGATIGEVGLNEAILEDGYQGIQTIDGKRYWCVSQKYSKKHTLCAVAPIDEIYRSNRFMIRWTVIGFLVIMLLCISYAVIVRNDHIARGIETEHVRICRIGKHSIYYERSLAKRVLPLLLAGVFAEFVISFYAQTLVNVGKAVENCDDAVTQITLCYDLSRESSELVETHYENCLLARARLIAYILEQDPSALNESSELYHAVTDEDGNRVVLKDDEGNPLRSVAESATLKSLCESNTVSSIYVTDEDGRTIATSAYDWYFCVGMDESKSSYPFRSVLDGKREYLVQQTMEDEEGRVAQYIGVRLHYYTTLDDEGNTLYVSKEEYGRAAEIGRVIHPHTSLLAIAFDGTVAEGTMRTVDRAYIFAQNTLTDGFIMQFDSDEAHTVLYSASSEDIGKPAEKLGFADNLFGDEYYGFRKLDGRSYLLRFSYRNDADACYIAAALPLDRIHESRMAVSLITAGVSFLLIVILSALMTLTRTQERVNARTERDAGEDDPRVIRVNLSAGHNNAAVAVSARWDGSGIPWRGKTPEQKLWTMLGFTICLIVIYFTIKLTYAQKELSSEALIACILRGNWDRNLNVFAVSVCLIVMIMYLIVITLIRLPIILLTRVMGTRLETIGHLLMSVARYGGTIGCMFYCLYLLGVDSTQLLASAGILSLVIGLGAQSLIKDILAGIFIVFEGAFRVGDYVTVSGFRGSVADISLRTTKVEDQTGNIMIFNNSEINGVLNMTRKTSTAACVISIEYGEDIEKVERILERELPLIGEKSDKIVGEPQYLGIKELSASGVDLLIVAKCMEPDINAVKRLLNRELLMLFYRNDINVPYQTFTVLMPDDEQEKQADTDHPND